MLAHDCQNRPTAALTAEGNVVPVSVAQDYEPILIDTVKVGHRGHDPPPILLCLTRNGELGVCFEVLDLRA
jgi:hypothetical protein